MPVVNYTNSLKPALVDFVASHNNASSEQHDLCRGTFQGVLEQPGLNLMENCLVLERAGLVKGLALVFPELPISRSVIELMTSPDLAGSPEELELAEQAVARAAALGVKVAHVCVPPDSGKGKLFQQLGFSWVRTYLEMLWNHEELPELGLPRGFSVRPFQNGDIPLLTRVQNDAFTGSWGFCPNTEEQIEYRTHMPNTSTAGILFLFDGQNPAGYCWTVMLPSERSRRGVIGAIGMIGVVPQYRGKGVSRHILYAGMGHLRSVGLTEIGLEVDGSNDPAVRLYMSTGFKKTDERHWFERVFPGT